MKPVVKIQLHKFATLLKLSTSTKNIELFHFLDKEIYNSVEGLWRTQGRWLPHAHHAWPDTALCQTMPTFYPLQPKEVIVLIINQPYVDFKISLRWFMRLQWTAPAIYPAAYRRESCLPRRKRFIWITDEEDIWIVLYILAHQVGNCSVAVLRTGIGFAKSVRFKLCRCKQKLQSLKNLINICVCSAIFIIAVEMDRVLVFRSLPTWWWQNHVKNNPW